MKDPLRLSEHRPATRGEVNHRVAVEIRPSFDDAETRIRPSGRRIAGLRERIVFYVERGDDVAALELDEVPGKELTHGEVCPRAVAAAQTLRAGR